MAKQTGIGSALFVGTTDVSGDIGSVQTIDTTRAPIVVTSIADTAESRITGLRDGSFAYNAYWNTAAGQAHLTLSALARTDQMTSLYIGNTLGGPAASMVGKQITYGPTRGQDGSLVASISAQANGSPLEWGEMLTTAKQTFAAGSLNGTAIDFGSVSTLFGSAAYLQVFSIASGTATVLVTDSSDNITFGTTLHTFTLVSGATTERLQGPVGGTVRRYVRFQVSGTYTTLVCAVNFVRYTESSAA